ncbi:MAG: hypothetical protein ACXWUG_05650 [Polyangiales bacterium]
MTLVALGTLSLSACFPMMPAGGGSGGGYGSSPPPSSGGGSSEASPGPGSNAGSSGGAAPAPAAPQIDSLTLHNDCKKTVKLFLGDKPKWGSGTNTSIGSNTTQSYSLGVGKMIWIVDDSENGVAQYTGQPGSHRIKIPASCTGFIPD